MKLVLELKNNPEQGDILVFNGTKFECISKNKFLEELITDIYNLNVSVGNINETLTNLDGRLRIQEGE